MKSKIEEILSDACGSAIEITSIHREGDHIGISFNIDEGDTGTVNISISSRKITCLFDEYFEGAGFEDVAEENLSKIVNDIIIKAESIQTYSITVSAVVGATIPSRQDILTMLNKDLLGGFTIE